MNTPNEPGRVLSVAIVLIVILGFVIRLVACQQMSVINPDGIYYIHQARVIYFGEWHSLTSCHLTFLSNYPFLVAGAYTLFHDCGCSIRLALFRFHDAHSPLPAVQAVF